jgi:hypothetical protein
MSAAKCLPGDVKLGQQPLDVDFSSNVRKPEAGYFCVAKDTIYINLNIASPADTSPFDVELCQRQEQGDDVVINAKTVDPQQGRFQLLALFSYEDSPIAKTRCFVRFRAGSSQVIFTGSIKSADYIPPGD